MTTIAEAFVNKLKIAIDAGEPIHARHTASLLDHNWWSERVDNIFVFYHFSDDSTAGTKPAKPAAMRKGKEYQAWVVEPPTPGAEGQAEP